jgi:hypothetical protein
MELWSRGQLMPVGPAVQQPAWLESPQQNGAEDPVSVAERDQFIPVAV